MAKTPALLQQPHDKLTAYEHIAYEPMNIEAYKSTNIEAYEPTKTLAWPTSQPTAACPIEQGL